MNGNEFIEARFIDEGHKNISILTKNNKGELIEDIIQADPTQYQYKELLKYTTKKAILDKTAEWKLESKRAFDSVFKNMVDERVKEIVINIENQHKEKLKEREYQHKSNIDRVKYTSNEKLKEQIQVVYETEDRNNKLIKELNLVQNRQFFSDLFLNDVIKMNKDVDALFKLKLAMFELDEVKKSSAAIKKKLRKTKTMMKCFAMLNEIYVE